MIFDKYPYTNFHEMNDDWVIQTLREFDQKLDAFVEANSLTYADPIEYNPATTYPANTVVIQAGVAYVSKQAVPAGLLPTADSDYWLMIFPFSSLIEQLTTESMETVIARLDAYIETVSAQIEQIEADAENAIGNIPASVNAWMDAHPEAITAVPYGSITFPKLSSDLKQVVLEGYDESANSTPINKSEFVQGGLDLNGEILATNACRTGYMRFNRGIVLIRAAANYTFRMWEYTMTGALKRISVTIADEFEAISVDEDHQYRFVIMRSDSTALSPADLPDIPVWYYFETPRYAINEKEYIYRESVKDENKLYVQKEWSLATRDWAAIHTILTADGDSLIMACNDTIRSTHFMKNVMTDNPIDLSHSDIGIDFDVITGTPGERTSYLEISEIDILLTSNNGYADATSDKFRIINNGNYILYDGNYKVSIPLDVTRNSQAPSIVDLTAVNGIAIQISTIPHTNEAGRVNYDGMPSIKINKLFSFRKPNRKQVMFGFDNAFIQQLDALEYLNDAGLTGTLFFPYGVIGDDGRMTTQNIRMLESKGNLISIYGSLEVTPSKYWYDMTLAEKKSAIALQADWSYRNAFGKGAKYMSTPAGGYAKDEDALVEDHFVDLITGRVNVSAVPIPTPFYTNLTHQGHAVGPAGTTANRKMAIDSLISSGGFVIFIFHQCAGQTDDITFQAFKDIVDYVKQKKELGLLEVVNADGIISNYELAYPPTI